MKEKIMSILFYTTVIIISLYIVVEVFIPEKTLDYFGIKSYVVVSNSMEPDINVNDVVIIRQVKEQDLEVRDVITFEAYLPELNQKGMVTHYIGDIETKSDGTRIYYTQGAAKGIGDYDEWTDEFGNPTILTDEDISGKVILTIPYVGHLIRIIKDPILLVMIAINVGIIYGIVKLMRTKNHE